MRALLISLVVAVLVPGCSEGDDATVEAGAGTTATTPTEATVDDGRAPHSEVDQAGDDGAAWCPTWAELRGAEEPTPEEIRGGAEVPSELRPVLDRLAEVMERSNETGEDPRGADLVVAMEASTELMAWAHEHCGDDHPFCVAWPTASLFLAQAALASDGDSAGFFTEGEGLQLVGLALDHAPSDVSGDAQTVRAWFDTPLDSGRERAAEAAYDSLDAWVEQHCEPLESE